MKLLRCMILPVLGSLALSSVASAYNFSSEDALFAKRGNSFRAATIARNAYQGTLNRTLTESEKKYAVTQVARLDVFRGAMTPGVDKEDAKDVFEDCLDTVKTIEYTESQEYYYYHLACVAFRGKLSSSLGRLKWALKLKSAQNEALESMRNKVAFDGGGILRVLSAVRGNRQAKPLGLYNAQEALAFAKRALNTPSTAVRPFPMPLSGSDYHENYYYYALALVSVAIDQEDKIIAEKAYREIGNAVMRLDDLEDMEELPEGREPETAHYKGEMIKMERGLGACLNSGSKWRSCLIKNFS